MNDGTLTVQRMGQTKSVMKEITISTGRHSRTVDLAVAFEVGEPTPYECMLTIHWFDEDTKDDGWPLWGMLNLDQRREFWEEAKKQSA